MVWGAFCGTLKSDLVFIPGKAKIDSVLYVETVMEPHLITFWHRTCEEYGWVGIMEDGAPGHKGAARQYRQLNEMESIKWPAQSPDLNLIEALWLDMESELGETWSRIGDIPALERALDIVWQRISCERLLELIDSMPQWLQAVIDAEGGAIVY